MAAGGFNPSNYKAMTADKTHDSKGRARRKSQGGAGPKPLPSKEAPKAGAFDPTPPPHLVEHGLQFWNDSVRSLVAMGYIDSADRIFLIHSAEAFQLYKECRDEIESGGKTFMNDNGDRKAHPLMTTMLKAGKDVFSYLSSLGLTPSARAKFGGGGDEDDPFEELLNARN